VSSEHEAVIQVLASIAEIDAGAWDRNANPDPATRNPFVSHAFLKALEDAGAVSARTGWQPQHLVLPAASGEIGGCMPLYAKSHSKGEYVFDYGWADAYENAGGAYYPKLLGAVPFTARRFHKLGFAIEEFGGNAFLVNAVPAHLPHEDIGGLLRDMLEDLQNLGARGIEAEHLVRAAAVAACRQGDALGDAELEHLLDQLLRTRMPYTCPRGRPTMIAITRGELDRRFGLRG